MTNQTLSIIIKEATTKLFYPYFLFCNADIFIFYRYLHVAACNTDTNLIQALLERLTRESMDWLIDLENKKRMTPLYLTVLGNEPEMVDVFLQNGANPNSMAQVG